MLNVGVPYVIPLESIEIQLVNGKETEHLSASSSQMIVEEVSVYFNMKFYTQHHVYLIDLHIGMSKRVGGGNATVIEGGVHIRGEICPRSNPDIAHMRYYHGPLKLKYK